MKKLLLLTTLLTLAFSAYPNEKINSATIMNDKGNGMQLDDQDEAKTNLDQQATKDLSLKLGRIRTIGQEISVFMNYGLLDRLVINLMRDNHKIPELELEDLLDDFKSGRINREVFDRRSYARVRNLILNRR